jgi:GDP-4-dehydro-6-deoxy-D-mannose reductase
VCDVTDERSVSLLLRRIEPDVIVHLAAISRVDFEHPGEIYRINVQGTANMLAAAASLDRKPSFLYISSSQVYGNPAADNIFIDEGFPVLPVNHYGSSKAAAEMITRAYRHDHGLHVVIARPFNHTGPGQTSDFVLPKIVGAFREGRDSLELGNIDTSRDFLDVRDVVDAYCLIIENFHDGEVYNIASGHGIRIRDVIATCERLTSRRMRIVQREELMRRSEIMSILGSARHIHEDLGWTPGIQFQATLAWMLSC